MKSIFFRDGHDDDDADADNDDDDDDDDDDEDHEHDTHRCDFKFDTSEQRDSAGGDDTRSRGRGRDLCTKCVRSCNTVAFVCLFAPIFLWFKRVCAMDDDIAGLWSTVCGLMRNRRSPGETAEN